MAPKRIKGQITFAKIRKPMSGYTSYQRALVTRATMEVAFARKLSPETRRKMEAEFGKMPARTRKLLAKLEQS